MLRLLNCSKPSFRPCSAPESASTGLWLGGSATACTAGEEEEEAEEEAEVEAEVGAAEEAEVEAEMEAEVEAEVEAEEAKAAEVGAA